MRKIYLVLLTLSMLQFGYGQNGIVYIDRSNLDSLATRIYSTEITILAKGFERSKSLSKGTTPPITPAYSSKGWTSTNLLHAQERNEFVEWSVMTKAGSTFNISEVNLRLKTSDAKSLNNFQIFYSFDDFSTFSALIPAKTLLSTVDFPLDIKNLSVFCQESSKVSFRLYAWGDKLPTANASFSFESVGTSPNINNGYLPVTKAGCIIDGNVEVEEPSLIYDNNAWTNGVSPSNTTGTKNVRILNGVYNINTDVEVKNIEILEDALVNISPTGNLIVNGNLKTQGLVILTSSSTQYPSLIVNKQADGKVVYQRHVNIFGENDLISAPVTGEIFNEFLENNNGIRTNGTLYLFGPFEKSIGDYVFWSNTETSTLNPGIGYRAGSENYDAFTFYGKVNTDTINTTITSSGPSLKKWNLIGNPYPSYISFDDFYAANNHLFEDTTSSVYGYDGDVFDGWIMWNELKLGMNKLIAPGQGFYVSSKFNTAEVTFTPSMRRTGTSDDFIEGRAYNDNSAFLQLNISSGKKNYKTEIYFNEKSTKGLDKGYDGAHFGSKAPGFAIYSHLLESNSGIDFAMQSLSFEDLSNDTQISLGINASKGEKVILSLGENTLPEGTEVYLEDNLNNTFTLLNTSDYTFTATSKISGSGRFFLRTSNTTLALPDVETNGLHLYIAPSKSLVIKGLLMANTTASIFDMQGRKVSMTNLKANTNSNQLNLADLSSGVYVVKVKNNFQEKTQKIIVK